jgi:hypothetical protein
VTEAVNPIEPTSNAALNPYESPGEYNHPFASLESRPEPADFRYWRLYVFVHLVLVLVAALFSFADSAIGYSFIEHSRQADGAMTVLVMLALTGGRFIWALPFVLVALIVRAIKRDWRYVLTALAEILLNTAWLFVMLPAVQ